MKINNPIVVDADALYRIYSKLLSLESALDKLKHNPGNAYKSLLQFERKLDKEMRQLRANQAELHAALGRWELELNWARDNINTKLQNHHSILTKLMQKTGIIGPDDKLE